MIYKAWLKIEELEDEDDQIEGSTWVTCIGKFETLEEAKKNVQLRAAAPKLYEACKYCYTLLTQNIGQQTHAIAMIEQALAEAEKGS